MTDLVGRAPALSEVWRLLGSGNRTVCVTGDPGAGKSAVLAAVAGRATAEGWQVVELRGRPAEQALPFAGLADLLSGRGLTLADRSRAEAEQLAATLVGSSTGGAAVVGALALRFAVLSWLQDAAAPRPVCVVVDDQQWLDESSWSVLSFVANRLTGTALSCLVATRAALAATGLDDGTPTVRSRRWTPSRPARSSTGWASDSTRWPGRR